MSGKLYVCRGLPGSGKTFWAVQQVTNEPGTIRVNRDEIRQMAHAGRFSAEREVITTWFRDVCVAQALSLGYTVISDDTNLQNHAVETLMTIAQVFGAAIELVLFHVPMEVCIERDSRRIRPVGREVIETMVKSIELNSPRVSAVPTTVVGQEY